MNQIDNLVQEYRDMTVAEADNVGRESAVWEFCGQQAGLGDDGKCKWCRNYHRELAQVFA